MQNVNLYNVQQFAILQFDNTYSIGGASLIS